MQGRHCDGIGGTPGPLGQSDDAGISARLCMAIGLSLWPELVIIQAAPPQATSLADDCREMISLAPGDRLNLGGSRARQTVDHVIEGALDSVHPD
jgi:hypothetical protein